MASKVDYRSGASLDVPRGCGLSFTFAFLPDFAPDFARTQYAAYRHHFIKTTLGFVGIREYPPGLGRQADIDSGPIILQVGAAATGIGIAATRAMGDDAAFESIVRLAETIGFPTRFGGRKSYLLGQLLVGDELQVWGKTIVPWSVAPPSAPASSDPGWPPLRSISLAHFYGIAGLTGGVLLLLTTRLIRRICRH
jgi:hypothetical protein